MQIDLRIIIRYTTVQKKQYLRQKVPDKGGPGYTGRLLRIVRSKAAEHGH